MNSEPIISHSRPYLEDREIAAVVQALRAGHLAQGEEVALLERDLSALFDAGRSPPKRYARASEVVVVSSGTAALYLALVALGAQKGKKVIIPSYTCRSLYAAVAHAGATPICADTGKDSVCITPSSVSPLLDDTVGAVIVPHMFGYRADIDAFLALGCPVIEDCAQSAGGRHADGALLGSKGHIAVLSFYGTKLLPAGEGGACVTRRKELAETIRLLRNCDERPLNPCAFNFKMGDLNAALARAKLQSLPAMNERRAFLAQRYDEAFGEKSFRKKSADPQAVCFRYLVELPSRAARDKRACQVYQAGSMALSPSRSPGRSAPAERGRMAAHGKGKDLKSFLKQALEAGIMCRRPVWEPLHSALGGKCPRTEQLQDTLVSVPLYPGLSEDEVEKICTTLPKMLI
ncbi:MAG: DegT/DnrJ/EryC1/StrS aminotransferase family protein [Verrucomicrobia bacterium]|nr:DegT/DnrJ/EryC1/StrS aminotransferase family protein [Verrucomicrobiota bacterium]MBU4285351.1 DegT/DnrJ/EryC1/StrS aminotransferase family protein [Verrucomicrobiota bacterium]